MPEEHITEAKEWNVIAKEGVWWGFSVPDVAFTIPKVHRPSVMYLAIFIRSFKDL